MFQITQVIQHDLVVLTQLFLACMLDRVNQQLLVADDWLIAVELG